MHSPYWISLHPNEFSTNVQFNANEPQVCVIEIWNALLKKVFTLMDIDCSLMEGKRCSIFWIICIFISSSSFLTVTWSQWFRSSTGFSATFAIITLLHPQKWLKSSLVGGRHLVILKMAWSWGFLVSFEIYSWECFIYFARFAINSLSLSVSIKTSAVGFQLLSL